ncbi:hypothetical protein B0H10DRAFT_1970770 [Mycena sp. CBHHK59/15]|nr:hypothetical protein B0H10DRAFT_1970770 [Mycena sp. CBHHK59/15]
MRLCLGIFRWKPLATIQDLPCYKEDVQDPAGTHIEEHGTFSSEAAHSDQCAAFEPEMAFSFFGMQGILRYVRPPEFASITKKLGMVSMNGQGPVWKENNWYRAEASKTGALRFAHDAWHGQSKFIPMVFFASKAIRDSQSSSVEKYHTPGPAGLSECAGFDFKHGT